MSAATKREAVEMVDGRVYFSDDGWETVWKRRASHWADDFAKRPSRRVMDKAEADLVRFIAAAQSSASPNWKKP